MPTIAAGAGQIINSGSEKGCRGYCAVIGGRTVEDRKESEIRYASEIPTSKIHIESWDSFLRKLRRM